MPLLELGLWRDTYWWKVRFWVVVVVVVVVLLVLHSRSRGSRAKQAGAGAEAGKAGKIVNNRLLLWEVRLTRGSPRGGAALVMYSPGLPPGTSGRGDGVKVHVSGPHRDGGTPTSNTALGLDSQGGPLERMGDPLRGLAKGPRRTGGFGSARV